MEPRGHLSYYRKLFIFLSNLDGSFLKLVVIASPIPSMTPLLCTSSPQWCHLEEYKVPSTPQKGVCSTMSFAFIDQREDKGTHRLDRETEMSDRKPGVRA
jgi:hypothetical protein